MSGKPTYFDMDNLRKEIGASIGRTEGAYMNEKVSSLKDMYSKLSDMQEGVANALTKTDASATAGKLWGEAKALDKQKFRLQEGTQYLFDKDLGGSAAPKVDTALSQLSKGNPSRFNNLMESIPPEHRGRVLVSALDNISSKVQNGNKIYDAAGFNKWYGELNRLPANKKMLHDSLPEGVGQQLDDVFKLSQGLQNITSVPKTGIVKEVFKKFNQERGLLDNLYGLSEKAGMTGKAVSKIAQLVITPG